MSPFGFWFKRTSNAWLVSRAASTLFAMASVLVVAITPVSLGYVSVPENPNFWQNVIWGVGGVAGVLSRFFIWGGMWAYWTRCDSSRRTVKRIWFMVLLFGFWYGAVLYYLFKYLPAEGPKHKARIAEEDK